MRAVRRNMLAALKPTEVIEEPAPAPEPVPATVDTDAIVAAVVERMTAEVLPAFADAMTARFASMIPQQDTSELQASIEGNMQDLADQFRIAIADASKPRKQTVKVVRDEGWRISGFEIGSDE